jgi:16S rRNA processing protein RimM
LQELTSILVGAAAEQAKKYTIDNVSYRQRSIVMNLREILDRSAAEKLVGQLLFVREREAVTPKKGSYFVHDLIGCEVRNTSGEFLGVIDDVLKSPAHDVWQIRHNGQTKMLPAVKNFIKSVDLESKTVVVRQMEGLFES